MSGFDCQFIEEPPQYLQCNCPICLLILREPYQVTCCGKSYCRDCIQKIRTRNKPCPTCKAEKFDAFQNKGFQQPLYGFRVFCSNKEEGCGWQGELGQLDQHINVAASCDIGCGYTDIKCTFCLRSYWRKELKCHQNFECIQRPFICTMCNEYQSIYKDVVINHAPECKCRPVECPNSCGARNLQHQHLEEHVSSQCPLTLVECEFSDAGCDAKVYRRDLLFHLMDNVASHLLLLAREIRNLKIQLCRQDLRLQQHQETVMLELNQQCGEAKEETASLKRQLIEAQKKSLSTATLLQKVQGEADMLRMNFSEQDVRLGNIQEKIRDLKQKESKAIDNFKQELRIHDKLCQQQLMEVHINHKMKGEVAQLKEQLDEVKRKKLLDDLKQLQLGLQEIRIKQRLDKIEREEDILKNQLGEVQRETLHLKELQKKTDNDFQLKLETQGKLHQEQITNLKEVHAQQAEKGNILEEELHRVQEEALNSKVDTNEDLKLKVEAQRKEHYDQITSLKEEISHLKERLRSHDDHFEAEKRFTQNFSRIAPLELASTLSEQRKIYKLEPFYSHAGGYKLQFEAILERNFTLLKTRYNILDSEFAVKLPCMLEIATMLCNQEEDQQHIMLKHTVRSNVPPKWAPTTITGDSRYNKNYFYMFEVLEVNIV